MQQITVKDGEYVSINGKVHVYDNDMFCEATPCWRCGSIYKCDCEPISAAELRNEILSNCSGKTIWPSDIADKYDACYDDVMVVLNGLRSEGMVVENPPVVP